MLWPFDILSPAMSLFLNVQCSAQLVQSSPVSAHCIDPEPAMKPENGYGLYYHMELTLTGVLPACNILTCLIRAESFLPLRILRKNSDWWPWQCVNWDCLMFLPSIGTALEKTLKCVTIVSEFVYPFSLNS